MTGWFRLLETIPVAGLIDLDALVVLDNVLLIPIALTVYVALRKNGPSLVAMEKGSWLLSVPRGTSGAAHLLMPGGRRRLRLSGHDERT